MCAEPLQSDPESAASTVSRKLEPLIAKVRLWAGPRRIAMLLSGSHAAGDAVWAEHGGLAVSLSDVDLYVVLPSPGACRAAEARASRECSGLREWLLEQGCAAPLEAAFLTPADLERLPPRPATLELRAHALVIEGDPTLKERVPVFTAREVPAEEVTLLLENRGFELLLAHPALAGATPLDHLRARHGLLKAALDLAGVAALAAGEYPERAAERVAWAREHPLRLVSPWPDAARGSDPTAWTDLDRLWDEALAWRGGSPVTPGPAEGLEDWHRAARAWCAFRWHDPPRGRARDDPSPYRSAARFARRARLARRVRRALRWHARSGEGPSLGNRLRHTLDGTPQHRVNAAAAVLLLAAVEARAMGTPEPVLGLEAARALERLGVVGRGSARDWASAARAVLRAWDLWVLDGQRTAGVP